MAGLKMKIMKRAINHFFTRRDISGMVALGYSSTLLTLLGAMLWFVYGSALETSRTALDHDIQVVGNNMRLRLDGNRDYLQLLAGELASGGINEDLFQERVSLYVADHPELINVTWVGPDHVIRTVAPLEGNRQIVGLTLNLPEPKRAAAKARTTGQPVYTKPFEAIQGNASFEVWVPILRRQEFLGLIAGVYSCNRLLERVAPEAVLQRNHLMLMGPSGAMIGGLPARETVEGQFVTSVQLAPPGNGMRLVTERYGSRAGKRRLVLLGIVAIVLSLGTGFWMWMLSRELHRRRQAETAGRKNEAWLSLSTETTGVAVWEYDLVKNQMARSQNHESLYGVEPQEIWTKDDFLNALHPDDRTLATDITDQSIAAGGPERYHFDYRTIWPDQSVHWLSITGAIAERNSDGVATLMRGCLMDITERKMAEMELVQSRKMLLDVVDACPDLMWLKDENGVYLLCNQRFEQFFGAEKENIVGRSDYDFMSKELADFFREHDQNAAEHGGALTNEEALVFSSDGHVEQTETIKTPLYKPDGSLFGVLGIGRDITERKIIKADLEQSRKLLDDVLNATPDMIWMKDPDGVFIMCNAEFEKLAGATRDQLIGSTDYDFFPKEQADTCLEQDRQAVLDNRMFTCEEPMRHATFDCDIWYETIKVPMHDNQGKLLGVLGVGRNITDRRQGAARLSQSQKLTNDMVDALPEMLWLKDSEGKYLLCNREFEALVSRKKGEILGLTDYDLFPQEKADFYRKQDLIAVQNKATTINEESADYDADGYSIWIETLKTPVYGQEGQLIGILGIGRDISRRRDALLESQEKQDFLNLVVDQSPVPMYITSPNGTALRCNQAVRDLWNLPPEQGIVKYSLLNDDNLKIPEIAKKIERVRVEKQAVRVELHWDPNKVQGVDFGKTRRIWLDLSVFPLLNTEREITHLVVQMVDISDQKMAEKNLMRQQMDLENEVMERTKVLRQTVNAMAGRENRMADLKIIIQQLCTQLEDAGMTPHNSGAKEKFSLSDIEGNQ